MNTKIHWPTIPLSEIISTTIESMLLNDSITYRPRIITPAKAVSDHFQKTDQKKRQVEGKERDQTDISQLAVNALKCLNKSFSLIFYCHVMN